MGCQQGFDLLFHDGRIKRRDQVILRAGVERAVVDGLQHNPYRNVYAAGGNVAEIHPFLRTRNDFFVRISQSGHFHF